MTQCTFAILHFWYFNEKILKRSHLARVQKGCVITQKNVPLFWSADSIQSVCCCPGKKPHAFQKIPNRPTCVFANLRNFNLWLTFQKYKNAWRRRQHVLGCHYQTRQKVTLNFSPVFLHNYEPNMTTWFNEIFNGFFIQIPFVLDL